MIGIEVVSISVRAVCARCARARAERAGAELGGQQPVDLPLAVVQSGGKAADAFAVDETVGDQAHRPTDDIGADVPLRRPR